MTALLALLCLAAAPALERSASEVAATVEAKHFAPPVGIYLEGAPAALPRSFASLLAAALDERHLAPVVIDAHDATEAERLARERGVVSLLRLAVAVSGASLTIRGDVITTRVNFWSAQVPTRSGPAEVIASSMEADAQVMTLAAPTPSAAPTVFELRVTNSFRTAQWPVALGVGDLDGDHHAEVAVLVGDRLTLAGETRVIARTELTQPAATKPTREPFGLVIMGPGRLLAWSAKKDHAEGWTFARGGVKGLGAMENLTLDNLVLKPDPGINRFLPEVTWAGRPLTLPLGFQQVSMFGQLALFVFADGTGAIVRGTPPTGRVPQVGCGSTLADLDGDGTPEVVVTSTKAVGDADELRVYSLASFEAVQGREGVLAEATALVQWPLKGRAVLAQAGDLDGDGADEVVLGLWHPDGTGELLTLHRVVP